MTIRSLAASALIASALVAAPNGASSDPNPAISWLAQKPLTLWDWGLITFNKKAERAAEWLTGDAPIRFRGDADYSYVHSKMTMSIRSGNYAKPFTAENCNDVRREVLDFLFADTSKHNYDIFPPSTIDAWFLPPSLLRHDDRPDDIGERIAQVTYLTVTLDNFDGTGQSDGIECSGKITEVDVVATPH